jgi:hypothetical protein
MSLYSGIRRYGKDFKAIADVISNKTEAHIRSFFVNYRRRYNLDEVLEEYEKEHGGITHKREEEEVIMKIFLITECVTLHILKTPTIRSNIFLSQDHMIEQLLSYQESVL